MKYKNMNKNGLYSEKVDLIYKLDVTINDSLTEILIFLVLLLS